MRLSALLFLLAVPTLPAHSRNMHGDAWAREKFSAAERMREALNGRPSAERTRRDYQRVIDGYRRVYFGCPTASKADPSVVAVAELDHAADSAKQAAVKKEKAKPVNRAKNSGPLESDEDSNDTQGRSEKRNRYARVTGVRHWSTPDYTRVAIDVEQDIKFGSE